MSSAKGDRVKALEAQIKELQGKLDAKELQIVSHQFRSSSQPGINCYKLSS